MIPGNRVMHREDLYIEHRPDPAKQASKSSRNLRIIERAVQAGDRSSRTLYYYANELRDSGRDADALEAYAAYLQDPGVEWEQYTALISSSECSERLGRSEGSLKHLYAAVRLFVSPPDYTWRPWDYISVCLANLDRHEDSIAATIRSLNAGNPDRDRLRSNLHWSVHQLA